MGFETRSPDRPNGRESTLESGSSSAQRRRPPIPLAAFSCVYQTRRPISKFAPCARKEPHLPSSGRSVRPWYAPSARAEQDWKRRRRKRELWMRAITAGLAGFGSTLAGWLSRRWDGSSSASAGSMHSTSRETLPSNQRSTANLLRRERLHALLPHMLLVEV